MALMFSRQAHNFIRNGYYPTDEKTLARLMQAIDTTAAKVAILDPCCGEGSALAEMSAYLEGLGTEVKSYGVEYNEERASNARKWLDVVAHSDIADMAIKVRQFGLLFLNAPYGDLVADQAQLSKASSGGRKRLEKEFYLKAHPWLAHDGVLVLIVPHTVLDAEFSELIAKSYRNVRVFMTPEQQFKQCVVFGIRKRYDRPDPALAKQLEEVGTGTLPPELPENWSFGQYAVPVLTSNESLHFVAARINAQGLEHELAKMWSSTLWPQFDLQFKGQAQAHRRPLRAMRDWHLALALAAGQITGVVTSDEGRKLLVKGDTHKGRSLKVTLEAGKDGEMLETRVFTDRFVPVIRAIDVTPGTPMFGQLVTIQ